MWDDLATNLTDWIDISIAILALITAIATAAFNYWHANRMSRRSTYPDLQVAIGNKSHGGLIGKMPNLRTTLHPVLHISCHGVDQAQEAKSIRTAIYFKPVSVWRRWRKSSTIKTKELRYELERLSRDRSRSQYLRF